jgi:hypothetical protein
MMTTPPDDFEPIPGNLCAYPSKYRGCPCLGEEVTSASLRPMRTGSKINLYPATYRLVYDNDKAA